jgi:uncharacterized repeat protein (TIGR01451 family)
VAATSALAATTYKVDLLPQLSVVYPFSYPNAISPTGVVVGNAYVSNLDGDNAVMWSETGQIANLSPGAIYGEALDINKFGSILLINDNGSYVSSQGTLTPVSAGTLSVQGSAINDAGQITGQYTQIAGGFNAHAYILDKGVLTDLGTLPGDAISTGYDINNKGQVAGVSISPSGQRRAVLWSNGSIVDLGGLPGYPQSYATGINDAGQVVGISSSGTYPYTLRTFLWENGVMTDIGSVGENSVVIGYKINNAGQIVGNASGKTPSNAFVWSNGVMTNLNPVVGIAGVNGCSATAINDAGQISGQCNFNVFKLTPAAAATDVGVELYTSPDTPARQGDPLTYVIRVTNVGSFTATNIGVADTLPSSVNFVSAIASQGSCSGAPARICTLGDLPPGASATVQITVIPTATGSITNSVAVTLNEVDVNPANNSATSTVTVSAPVLVVPTADVGVTMSGSASTVNRLSNLTYTVNVKNSGPANATGVVVTDTLPSSMSFVSARSSQGSCSGTTTVTCNLGAMANGANANVTIVVRPRTAGTYANSVRVSSNIQDSNAANNTASVTTRVK